MAPLVEALAAQEHHVELISGLDESRLRWREAGQRHGTRAVYVACGGPTLPSLELEALRQDLQSLGIPDTSVWTGVVDWTKVDRLIRDVEHMTVGTRVVSPPPIPMLHSSSVPAIAAITAPPTQPPGSARLAPMGPGLQRQGQPMQSPTRRDDSVDPFELPGRSRRRWALAMGSTAALGLGLVVMLGLAAARDGEAPLVAEAAAGETTESAAARRPGNEPSAPADASDSTAEAEPMLEVAARPILAPEPADDDDGQLVHEALMQRKIRALDILLVSPEARRKVRRKSRVNLMSWADAQAHCEALDIDGVKGWRLPTAGEFRTLSGSNMLERRSYWSATEADAFGSDRVVWNNLKKAMAPAPGEWKGGRVLCVRLQHPEHASPA
ncbi:hypothetical protein [Paraliomyxa miuraensis]|uniref:hypothetical protein n=1 Tax=Paraliomyxa miuraensis TaxID=376150 RepID=UPI002250C5BB|nr:hypothetical protein [Paraliomyxa miuraensis]MCX4241551.1 hypothetical protein [Paraliomyxa miuraensis]